VPRLSRARTRSLDSSGGCARSRRTCAPLPNACGSLQRITSKPAGMGSGSTSLGTHTHLGLRCTISKESPSRSVIHPLRSAPRYLEHPPTSGVSREKIHQLAPAPPWLLLDQQGVSRGCTFAFITSPPVSTKRWRLRPFTFLAPSYPRAPFFGGSHRLADYDGRARTHSTTFPKTGSLSQGRVDALPRAIDAPSSEVVVVGGLCHGKKSWGSSLQAHPPLTT
jgi:hypothetical protein